MVFFVLFICFFFLDVLEIRKEIWKFEFFVRYNVIDILRYNSQMKINNNL